MTFHVLTLFPEMIENAMLTSITGRAIRNGLIDLDPVNIRDFAEEKRKGRVDDYPYGGGAGMVMQAEPVYGACMSVRGENKDIKVLHMSPKGRRFDQKMARELAKEKELIILCGHYEGIDERVIDEIVTDEISIGDYVMTGGELAALVVMDCVSRMVPGVLNNDDSAVTESFQGDGLLEYPQYTRPEVWREKRVPDILLSGNHPAVDRWRRDRSLEITAERRPDLCGSAVLDKKDCLFIREKGLEEFYPAVYSFPEKKAGRRKRKEAFAGSMNPDRQILNLVFDVGYVLLSYSWKEDFKAFGYDDKGAALLGEKIFELPKGDRYWEKYDMGLVTDEEVVEHYLKSYPEDKEALSWFFDNQSDWCLLTDDLPPLLPKLREKGYGIYLLSNYPSTMLMKHLSKFGLDKKELVDGIVVSGDEKTGKPDPAFFRILLNRYALNAEECLFLDDREDNTKAAAALGFQTITLSDKKMREEAVELLKALPDLKIHTGNS